MNSIELAIGNTPMVELKSFDLPPGIRIFAKLEFLNPGGSIKDRVVNHIFNDAEARGLLCRGSTVIENTSGNTGAAIAMLAAARGYRVILTMPDKVSKEKKDTLRALGAEVIMCPTSAAPDSPEHYVQVAKSLHADTPNSFMLHQYDNPLNPEAHKLTTGPEIWRDLKGGISVFVAAGSTGGTISGISRYLKSQDKTIRSVLLDPKGSIYYKYFYEGVIDPLVIGPYQVEGVGEDHLAKCMDFEMIDDVIQFDDAAAFGTCRLLAQKEGLLCGGSSGANVWGCLQVAKRLSSPANIVTVLPDSGVKYLSKIYNSPFT
ncbi:PLP-dependent cysteine synthase family protein [Pseudomonas syringae]|uniref:PLP-dependent cysteine synthase family protein n=1 Tax=Pseudomonas syringae TaxID=317 RepID=UPI003F877357